MEDVVNNLVDVVDQADRSLDLSIRGIPLYGHETVQQIRDYVVHMGTIVNLSLDEVNLVTVFRVRPRNDGRERDSVVIAKFGSNGIRHQFYSRYFQRQGFDALDLGFATSKKIYISDNLTKANAKIRGLATALKRSHKIANFSIREGVVRVKVKSDSTPVPIHTSEDLDLLVSGQQQQQNEGHDQAKRLRDGSWSNFRDRNPFGPGPVSVGQQEGTSGLIGAVQNIDIREHSDN